MAKSMLGKARTAAQKAATRKWQAAGAAKRKGKLSFSSDAYMRSHGRGPKGSGQWAFGVGKKTHFVRANVTLSQAKKLLRAKLVRLGHSKDITAHVLP
jgi:hypothetical protein